MAASGGTGSKTFSETGLPDGLTLASATGIVSGSPDNAKNTITSVTFTVTDDNDKTDTLTVSFPIINAASVNVTWSAAVSGTPTSLTKGSAMDSFDLSNSVNNEPATVTYSVFSGSLPAGIDLSGSGTVSGTPTTVGAATSVTFRVKETGSATNFQNKVVTFPAVAGGGLETVTFTTAAALSGTSGGQDIDETIVATGSQGSVPTYTFVSTSNTGNSNASTATPFTLAGNTISGIAPRLFNAATYSFEIQASINAGAVTNNRTFTLLISQDAACVSPINNICT